MKSLPYELSNVALDSNAYINSTSLNSIYAKLVQNDNSLVVTNHDTPLLWEQRWFNDQQNKSLFYREGDAVWINTENIDDVVTIREADLYNYASSNATLKNQLDQFLADDDRPSYYSLLKQFALGKLKWQNNVPIYFIGDLTKRAQVRISTVDNNTALPDDDTCWEDFFFDQSIESIQAGFLSTYENILLSSFEQHLNDYHLTNTDISKHQLSNELLLKDFSNLSGQQQFRSHEWHVDTQSGFDCVKAFQSIVDQNGNIRWFRIWNSGLLEHGGTVTAARGLNEVRFDIKYDNVKFPIYDYPSEGLNKFYNDKLYEFDGKFNSMPITYLGGRYHYTVTITPIQENEPYAKTAYGYESVDVCIQNNDSFSFLNDTDCKKFSYKVEGYSLKSKDF